VFQSGTLTVALVALIAALASAGAYTFQYGEGLSYFSTDPRACRNCHVMNDQYASWAHGPHHAVARCEAGLDAVRALQRKAQWRLDFVAAENSMGFHAPQETARVLAEAIDYARQGQLAAKTLTIAPVAAHK
jgi:hypothetical protein